MYRIQADNPTGLDYDLTFTSQERANSQIRTLISRGITTIKINGTAHDLSKKEK